MIKYWNARRNFEVNDNLENRLVLEKEIIDIKKDINLENKYSEINYLDSLWYSLDKVLASDLDRFKKEELSKYLTNEMYYFTDFITH